MPTRGIRTTMTDDTQFPSDPELSDSAEPAEDFAAAREDGAARGADGPPAAGSHRRVWLWVALGVCAVVALGGVGWWRAEHSPKASIGRVAKAAVDGDLETVQAAIDTTAIIGAAVDDIYNDPHFRASYVASYTAKHPTAKPSDIKDRLEKLANEEMAEHVASGSLPKRIPIPGDSIKGLVAMAYARHSVKSIVVKGGYAYATVSVPYHGKTYNVVVRLRRSGKEWVVDRIMNLAAVLKQAGY